MSNSLSNGPVLVIAEIGNNHEGNFTVAKEMVHAAAESGADVVKFQVIRPERLVGPEKNKRLAQLKSYELTDDQFQELFALAHTLNVKTSASVFDVPSVAFVGNAVDFVKISSGDNQFFPLISATAALPNPTIISTGLCTGAEIDTLVKVYRAHAHTQNELALLHCVSSYPTLDQDAGLNTIKFLKAQYPDIAVGYSDHTLGIDACIAAVALGATILEKHFTLDKNYSDFRDHQLSADPAELQALVTAVRRVENMLGNVEKIVQAPEQQGVSAYRRSIVAAHDLAAGHVLTAADLTWTRPGTGIAPGEEALLIGKTLNDAMVAGEQFALDAVR